VYKADCSAAPGESQDRDPDREMDPDRTGPDPTRPDPTGPDPTRPDPTRTQHRSTGRTKRHFLVSFTFFAKLDVCLRAVGGVR